MQSQLTWNTVPPTPLTSNGTTLGVVNVSNSSGFYVKQLVELASNTQPVLGLQIAYFISDSQFVVGLQSLNTPSRIVPVDISAYLVADSATISAPAQSRGIVGVKPEDVQRATFSEDPITAIRTIPVDSRGNPTNSAKTNSTVPVKYDSFQVLTTDGSGNPLTIAYYIGGLSGSRVWLSTFTYDGSGNASSYVGTP